MGHADVKGYWQTGANGEQTYQVATDPFTHETYQRYYCNSCGAWDPEKLGSYGLGFFAFVLVMTGLAGAVLGILANVAGSFIVVFLMIMSGLTIYFLVLYFRHRDSDEMWKCIKCGFVWNESKMADHDPLKRGSSTSRPPRRIHTPPPVSYQSEQPIGIQMVTFPAGVFLYGEDRESVHLPEYQLARTPVTNAQYEAFVEATGHVKPNHWHWGQIQPGQGDHPVVNVSWEDAQAFCEWAECRLPTEREWEKGARGTDGREYPWGNTWQAGCCNIAETGIGFTTKVTRHANGASPYGLLDMAGNVWEWCEDWYNIHSYRDCKVLCGGSFNDIRKGARCAARIKSFPGNRFNYIGFRCCVGLTSSP